MQRRRKKRESRRQDQLSDYHKSRTGATHDDRIAVAGMSALDTGKREKRRYWVLIILVAVLVHLVILFGVKPSYLNVFKKSLDYDTPSAARKASFPDAIIAITVDVEGEEPTPIEIEEPTIERSEVVHEQSEATDEPEDQSEDLEDILGDAQNPLPARPSTPLAAIPPKPVEITWPETKNLRHCLGIQVDVRIFVGKNGEILSVKPVEDDIPQDCIAAAVSAARRIVFLPGTVEGRPKEMWTEIRIDFRRQTD